MTDFDDVDAEPLTEPVAGTVNCAKCETAVDAALFEDRECGHNSDVPSPIMWGDKLYRGEDVAAAVQVFRNAIQHDEDDFEKNELHGGMECKRCGVISGTTYPCPVKVEEKLKEYFGPVLHGGEERGSG